MGQWSSAKVRFNCMCELASHAMEPNLGRGPLAKKYPRNETVSLSCCGSVRLLCSCLFSTGSFLRSRPNDLAGETSLPKRCQNSMWLHVATQTTKMRLPRYEGQWPLRFSANVATFCPCGYARMGAVDYCSSMISKPIYTEPFYYEKAMNNRFCMY